jgi:hypothetical protein
LEPAHRTRIVCHAQAILAERILGGFVIVLMARENAHEAICKFQRSTFLSGIDSTRELEMKLQDEVLCVP